MKSWKLKSDGKLIFVKSDGKLIFDRYHMVIPQAQSGSLSGDEKQE